MSHILVVDDEAPIRTTLGALLRRAGHNVTTAEHGEAAIALLERQGFDLLLVDLKMPGVDGMAVVRVAQAHDPDIVVIVLTGHGSLESAIEGVRRDIFDYLLKTSDPQDVLKRVAAGLEQRQRTEQRRQVLHTLVSAAAELDERVSHPSSPTNAARPFPQPAAATSAMLIGPLRIDPLRGEAELDGRTALLTPTELRVLVCLAQHADQSQTYTQIVQCAQGFETYAAEASELIKPHIHHLRQKLEADPAKPRYVLTVRGTGYMLALNAAKHAD